MDQLDLRTARRTSARALFGRSKVVVAGFLGDAVVGLIALLWEPLGLARWLGWMPRWAWAILAAAGFIWLTFEAFHRMRVELLGEVDRGEKEIAARDGRLRKLLSGGPEPGPGVEILYEALRHKPRPYIPAGMASMMPPPDDRPQHECEVAIRALRQVDRPAIYVWTDSPIYSAEGRWVTLIDGERHVRLLKPKRQLSRWAELFGGPPIPSAQKVVILLNSPQPIRVLRVALEPEWEEIVDD